MLTSKLISISSRDKLPESSSNSDFVVQLPEAALTQGVRGVSVKTVCVPNVFSNIRAGVNNTLTFTDSVSGLLTTTIPAGQYSVSTLITAVELAFAAVSTGTVAIVQDALTGKLSFAFAGVNASIDAAASLSPVLGISQTSALSPVIVAGSLPDLSGVNMVYIHSREIASGYTIDSGFGLVSAIDTISFHDTPYGVFATKNNFDFEMSTIKYTSPRNISRIRIVLRDDLGRRLDIGTANMYVILKVYFA